MGGVGRSAAGREEAERIGAKSQPLGTLGAEFARAGIVVPRGRGDGARRGRRAGQAASTHPQNRTDCIFRAAIELCSRTIARCDARIVFCEVMASSYAAISSLDVILRGRAFAISAAARRGRGGDEGGAPRSRASGGRATTWTPKRAPISGGADSDSPAMPSSARDGGTGTRNRDRGVVSRTFANRRSGSHARGVSLALRREHLWRPGAVYPSAARASTAARAHRGTRPREPPTAHAARHHVHADRGGDRPRPPRDRRAARARRASRRRVPPRRVVPDDVLARRVRSRTRRRRRGGRGGERALHRHRGGPRGYASVGAPRAGEEGGDGEGGLPWPAYLGLAAIVAIASVGSCFELTYSNPIFGVVQSDSFMYKPILYWLIFTGFPLAAFLWSKGIAGANEAAELQDKLDGY